MYLKKKKFNTFSKEKLIEKLQHYGFEGKELNLIKTYITNRKQMTKINNIMSEPMSAEFGIPQGGNLPPILYTLYVNDLFEQPFRGILYAYADDTCILYSGHCIKTIETKIKQDMKILEEWCFNNLLTINEAKTEYMIYTNKTDKLDINIEIKNQKLKEVSETTYLGLQLENTMKWDRHIQKLIQQNARTIAALNKIKHIIPSSYKKPLYHALFTAKNSYLINIWGNTTKSNLLKIQKQQNKVLKLIYKLHYRTPTTHVYEKTQELNVEEIIKLNNILFLHKIRNNEIKIKIKLQTNKEIHDYRTRRISHLRTEKYNYQNYRQTLTTTTINMYNKIPKHIKGLPYYKFKKEIKHLLKIKQLQ